MKFDLNQIVYGITGPLKNFIDPEKKSEDLKLKDLFIHVIITEKVLKDDRTGFVTVNPKTDDEKFSDFKLGLKMQGDSVVLDLTDVNRILKLAGFLNTNIYGALKKIISDATESKESETDPLEKLNKK